MSTEKIPEEWFGHAPEPVVVYRCSRCQRALTKQDDGTFTHEPQTRDLDVRYKEAKAAEKGARLAGTVEYVGDITRCQAMATRAFGRVSEFGRCERKPKFVRRLDTTGDILAVCRQHAGDAYTTRWTGHRTASGKPDPWKRDAEPASEQVEDEYRDLWTVK